MGYRGKVEQQEEARRLRAQGLTLADIAEKLGVAKSSVSLWVRDVPFTPSPRRYGPQRRANRLRDAKQTEIRRLDDEGRRRMSRLTDEAFFAAGIALYAGEGAKTDGTVKFANTDPDMIRFFCAWLRRFFAIDESRLRVTVYLHRGLDLDAAETFWSELTRVPRPQFTKSYRAAANPSIRRRRHENGCAYVVYSCSFTHRSIMGCVRALLSSDAIPG